MSTPLFTNSMGDYITTASGSITSKYISVFERNATSVVLQRYFPASGYSTDLPSQALYTTYNITSGVLAFIDIDGYSQSAGQLIISNALGQTHHERIADDITVGKIYIHPNYPYSGAYIRSITITGTNDWVDHETDVETYLHSVIFVLLDGKYFHLTNPQPKFINNQICYYESGLRQMTYASYDPFSRVFDQYGGLILARSYPDMVQDD